MVEKDFAVSGEVILLEGGGGESGLGIEKAGELRYECFSLERRMLVPMFDLRQKLSVPFRAGLEWWPRLPFPPQ